MNKRYLFAILIVILGLLFFFAPSHIAHVCGTKPDGSFMKCHWMGEAVKMLGSLVVVMGVLFALLKKYAKGLSLACILVAACQVSLQFFVIGTCKNLEMPCNVYTKPTVILFSILLVVVCGLYLFLTRKEE